MLLTLSKFSYRPMCHLREKRRPQFLPCFGSIVLDYMCWSETAQTMLAAELDTKGGPLAGTRPAAGEI